MTQKYVFAHSVYCISTRSNRWSNTEEHSNILKYWFFTGIKPSNTQLNSVKNKALWYLRWDDVEQVSRRCVLLAEHVAVLRLKQDVQNFDDKRAAAQRRGQAVLAQETTQLRLVLTHVLQSQFSTCKYTKQWWMKYSPSRPVFLNVHNDSVMVN